MVKSKWFGVLAIILFLVVLNVSLRNSSHRLDVIEDYAKQSLDDAILKQAYVVIQEEKPNLPSLQIEELAKQRVWEFSSTEEYNQALEQTIVSFKNHLKRNDGTTYLLELDPYFWARHAENILERGHPGDSLTVDGKWFDDKMLAPNGRVMPTDMFNAYLEAYSSKYFFDPIFGWDVFKTAFFMPVFLVSLATIVAFFVVFRMTGNSIGGLFAGLWIVIFPSFLSRTVAGFSDSDSYSVLMPLLIIGCFFEAYYNHRNWAGFLWVSLAGFFTGVFASAWIGWSFVFDVIVGTFMIYGVFVVMKKRELLKTHIIFFITYLVSSFVFTGLFRQWDIIIQAVLGPIWFMKMKQIAVTKIWPNVLTTVAEQNEISFGTLISGIGGIVAVCFLLFALVYFVWKKRYLALTLSLLFIVATTVASTKGVRYLQLMLPIVSILIGVSSAVLYSLGKDFFKKYSIVSEKFKDIAFVVCFLFVLGLLFYPIYSDAKYIARNDIPMMDDAWWNSLNAIKGDSYENAIIASWWDFGHWFKYVADRRVFFDGTSQDNPYAHWMGRVLQTNNPIEARNILEMMSTCHTDYASLNLTEILILKKDLVDSNKPFCEGGDSLPEVYFIVSEDMVGKGGVWAHFGLWDFTKAQFVQDTKKGNVINYDIKEEWSGDIYSMSESDLNTWISPWPSFSNLDTCYDKNDTWHCGYNVGSDRIIFDIDKRSLAFSAENSDAVPQYVVGVVNGSFVKFVPEKPNIPVGVISFGGSVMLADASIADSMFARLFYFDGIGLEDYFEFWRKDSSYNGWKIAIFKVKWEE